MKFLLSWNFFLKNSEICSSIRRTLFEDEGMKSLLFLDRTLIGFPDPVLYRVFFLSAIGTFHKGARKEVGL